MAVLGALLLLVVSSFLAPFSYAANSDRIIRIGVIAPWGVAGKSEADWGYDYLDYDSDLYSKLIAPELNAYLARTSQGMPLKVEFVVKSAYDGSNEYHLSALQELHESGIDLVIGGYWSGQAGSALDYVNENGMVLLSPSSTDPSLAITGDGLFRMVPTDTGVANPIAAVLNERGITKLVVIHCDNGWASGVINAVDAVYDGDMTDRVAYPESLDYNSVDPDYTSYLALANGYLTGDPGEGVLLLSYNPNFVLQQAADYDNIYGVEWFGADATALNSFIRDTALVEASNVKLYSSMAAIDSDTISTKAFRIMETKYKAMFKDTFGYYMACEVDAGWLLTLSVLEVRNQELEVTGENVRSVISEVASNYHGYSGICELDAAGDRTPGNYNVWGYDAAGYHLFATYDSASDTLSWLG